MASQPTVLIMAAGRGTRMHSSLPKVLHPVCGRPMVHWVIEAARSAGAGRIVCVVRPGEGVAEQLPEGVVAAEQTDGEGTGSAVLAAREAVGDAGTLVVLSGDHPLVSGELIADLVRTHESDGAAATMLTTEDLDPTGYGRIVRAADGSVERIVETKHADGVPPEELAIREINIGAYAFEAAELFPALAAVGLEHGERYLTGVFPLLRERGRRISAHRTTDVSSAMGVNTRADLMAVQEALQRRLVEAHARRGVTFEQPATALVEADVEIGRDTVIGPGVTLRSGTRIGEGCRIGPHTTVVGARIGNGVTAIQAYILDCEVADGVTIGPFAYLRPGTVVREGAKIGTYVEVKNSTIGAGTKVPHLSYLGDADVGAGANIAAGNITANYHAGRKTRTRIGDRVHTGVHTSFVAPVGVGDDAYTGAGSVITEDVPRGALGIARAEQRNVEGYAERIRAREESEG
ncbi:MAG: bifunctional UDP-N-acetylglucosamine diphosphorylase/glucosamine-1-phosphate N-acetyltransferase GlmU [Thermoleophilaceae bacterium]|nr:bifunctional UDP-N-acetylglucosamine diphosphorylase/glucosamine-1-phosphate N-acetyltransferase GlmU [Thermoleophilaceae bacterium]